MLGLHTTVYPNRGRLKMVSQLAKMSTDFKSLVPQFFFETYFDPKGSRPNEASYPRAIRPLILNKTIRLRTVLFILIHTI